MIRKIILSVVFIIFMTSTLAIFNTGYQTTVVNSVAVSQVEDSDENFIAVRHIDKPKKAVNVIGFIALAGILYLIWKPKKRVEENY